MGRPLGTRAKYPCGKAVAVLSELLKARLSPRQIAAKVGCNQSYVYQVRDRWVRDVA